MKYIRLYAGDDGQSHFEECSMEMADAEYGKLAKSFEIENASFGQIDNLEEVPWHNAPHPQYIIMLKGAMEIEIGSGAKKVFHEGDILLVEDTTGQGHITRAACSDVRKYLALPLKC